jgi:hypothetical protein
LAFAKIENAVYNCLLTARFEEIQAKSSAGHCFNYSGIPVQSSRLFLPAIFALSMTGPDAFSMSTGTRRMYEQLVERYK